MPIETHYLGWDAPAAAKVRGYLLKQAGSGPVDLGDILVVVPTRQAGRRLREALAYACGERKSALLSPRVVVPASFTQPRNPAVAASDAVVRMAWARVLLDADLLRFRGLFPAEQPDQTPLWAMQTGELLQRLRDELADSGYRIRDVVEQKDAELEERERWRDLALLEAAYLEQIGALGLRDPCELMIEQTGSPVLPEDVRRVVVAAVPDPTPLMIRALERLESRMPIDVLIHAPRQLADGFDRWGRALPARWLEAKLHIPDEDILLAGSPASQSRMVLDLIAMESGRFGPGDIAVGVPDSEVTPFLAADLNERGLHAFDPAGKPLSRHPIFGLLDAFRRLANESSYGALSAVLRHPDVLEFTFARHRLVPSRVLRELDEFHNAYLPVSFEDVAVRLPPDRDGADAGFASLRAAVGVARGMKKAVETGDLDAVVRDLLQAVYRVRTLDPKIPADAEFAAAAERVDAVLREFNDRAMAALEMSCSTGLEFLVRRLGHERYYPETPEAVMDLEGWLELPWNEAPFLIVTGMNEGSVPHAVLADPFLPDSLRMRLGLRHDGQRLARDAYLARTLVESRRRTGRVCFVAGKTSGRGDPLKPSRLLFRCGDTELPSRAARLFGEPNERRDSHPATVSFKLDPCAVEPVARPASMHVTMFRDYLACPFRFYLKHVLRMEEQSDRMREMEAKDFGRMIHYAMQEMARDGEMGRCCEERALHAFLSERAERWVKKRYGSSPPLPVTMALESGKQRLKAAARVQARLAEAGWEILHTEKEISGRIAEAAVSGRIDRIDRHRESGRLRILDYKTSDKPSSPEDVHLRASAPDIPEYARVRVGSRDRGWSDLQLPLYRLLLGQGDPDLRYVAELGYFNLPKALHESGVAVWESLDDALLASAETCASGVVDDVRRGRFWPPSKVAHDDYEILFPAAAEECMDAEGFAKASWNRHDTP